MTDPIDPKTIQYPIPPVDDPKPPVDDPKPPVDDPKPKPEDKAIKDMLRFKDEAKAERTAKEQALKELETFKEAKLKESNNWKQLYENSEAKRVEVENKLKDVGSSVVSDKRISAVEKAALQAGIKKEALQDIDMLDMSGLEIETTSTGRVNVLGVDTYVADLKALRPHWFGDGSPPHIEPGNPGYVGEKDMTGAQLLELSKKNPAEYRRVIEKRLKKTN